MLTFKVNACSNAFEVFNVFNVFDVFVGRSKLKI